MAENTVDNTHVPILKLLHKNQMSIKECYLLMELVLKVLFFCTSGLSCIFGVAVLWQFGIFENNTFGFALMSFAWLAICAMVGFIVHVIVIYFESKTDHLCSHSEKSIAILQDKFEQLTGKLERILENQQPPQQPKENAVFRTIRTLSVKSYNRATHSSETRTPSALDMSPIVAESTFSNMADNSSNPYQSDLQPLCLKIEAADNEEHDKETVEDQTADQTQSILPENLSEIAEEITVNPNVEFQKGVSNVQRNDIVTASSDGAHQVTKTGTADTDVVFQSPKAVLQKTQALLMGNPNVEAAAAVDLDGIHRAAVAACSDEASRNVKAVVHHQDDRQICEVPSDDNDMLMSSDAAQESLGL